MGRTIKIDPICSDIETARTLCELFSKATSKTHIIMKNSDCKPFLFACVVKDSDEVRAAKDVGYVEIEEECTIDSPTTLVDLLIPYKQRIEKLKNAIREARDYQTPMGSSFTEWHSHILEVLGNALREDAKEEKQKHERNNT